MKKMKKMLLCLLAVFVLAGTASELLPGAGAVCVQAAVTVPSPKIKAVKALGTTQVSVTWEAVGGAHGYLVYRKILGRRWQKVKLLRGNSELSFTDADLTPGAYYTYTVRAFRKVKGKYYWSTMDNTGQAVVTQLATPPLERAGCLPNGSTRIYWGAVDRAKGYYIYRKTAGTSWKRIAKVRSNGKTSQCCTDSSVEAGTTYIYTVRAYRKTSTYSAWSSYVKKGISVKAKAETPKISAYLRKDENPAYFCEMVVKNNSTKPMTLTGQASVLTPADNGAGNLEYDMWTIDTDGTNLYWTFDHVIPAGQEQTLVIARVVEDSQLQRFYVKTSSYFGLVFLYNGRTYTASADYYGNNLYISDVTDKLGSSYSDSPRGAILGSFTEKSLLVDSLQKMKLAM